jgi:hypothetical protein
MLKDERKIVEKTGCQAIKKNIGELPGRTPAAHPVKPARVPR